MGVGRPSGWVILALGLWGCSHANWAGESTRPAPSDIEVADPTAGSEGQDVGEPFQLVARPPSSLPPPQELLRQARRDIAEARETRYTHSTDIDEAVGRFHVDCSGFVGHLLAAAAPLARDELVASTVRRPLAKHFVRFITNVAGPAVSQHWSRLEDARQLVPGDIVAWLRAADSRSTDTGHVMIVRALVYVGTSEVHVPIIDSTALRHGRGDVRAASSSTGIGTGTIALRINSTGQPVAFRWALESRYKEHPTTIVLGRLR